MFCACAWDLGRGRATEVLGATGRVVESCLSEGVGATSRIGAGLASTRATSTSSAAAGCRMEWVSESAPSPNIRAWQIADAARLTAFRLRTAEAALALGIGHGSIVDRQARPHLEGFDGMNMDIVDARRRFALQARRIVVGDVIRL